jgi:hypothetical protein
MTTLDDLERLERDAEASGWEYHSEAVARLVSALQQGQHLRKLIRTVRQQRAILALIDERIPRADDTCDAPGITLSEAARRELRIEGHKAFRKGNADA